jgi:hypothetical protein
MLKNPHSPLYDMLRLYIKKLWYALPHLARELPLKTLCMLRIGLNRHISATTDDPGAPIYIIGNFQAGGGISQSATLYAKQMREMRQACFCVDVSKEMLQSIKNPMNDGSLLNLAKIKNFAGAGCIIIHLNPPQFLWLLCKLGRKFLRHKRVVAHWAWELEDIPSLWKFALRFVDAVETPSVFTRNAIARNTKKTVIVRPHVIARPNAVKQSFCNDGKLRCLFIFDMASKISRKNPQGVIAAFSRAFTPDEAELTITVSQTRNNASGWKELQTLAAAHPHIRLIGEWLDDAAIDRLFHEHDVYLSLHRSEGYGLTIREAMLRGLYVVATGWSGNMDFMEGERVFAVPYTLVPVSRSDMEFGNIPSARWAEPDIAKAAEILRNIRLKLICRSA